MKGKFLCWKSYASLIFESMFHEKYLNVFLKVCVIIYAQARQMRHMATKTSYTCAYATYSFSKPMSCHVRHFFFQFKYCADCWAAWYRAYGRHKNRRSIRSMHHLALRPRIFFKSFPERWGSQLKFPLFHIISFRIAIVSWKSWGKTIE